MIETELHECKLSKNSITYKYDLISCWIEDHYIDLNNINLYVLLLKHSLDKMKKKNITKFIQIVATDDWNKFLSNNSSWILVDKNPNKSFISCNIDEAAVNVCKGLGLIDV